MNGSNAKLPAWFTTSVRRLTPWTAGMVAALLATPAAAQGNIDAGKTPAQIFGDTCSGCHRSARDLKRTSASFLRAHYTTGSEEANAMANYLAGVGSDPRAGQPRRKEETAKQTPVENPKQNRQQQQQATEQGKGQPKGTRPAATAQARPVVAPVEEPAPEPPAPVVPPAPPAPPVPVLEPFEE